MSTIKCLFTIFSLCVLTTDAATGNACVQRSKLQCPTRNGKFLHELCCNLYYNCTDSNAALMECPADHVFDPNANRGTGECVPVADKPCVRNICGMDELPTCPTADPNTSFFHPKCCNLYYQCTGGTSVLDICPLDEVYDPIEKKCSAESAAVECKTNKCGLNGLPDPCPSGAYFKNPGCCPSYYQCVHGKAVLRPCAPGTWWNPDMTTCDHPWRTNCVDF